MKKPIQSELQSIANEFTKEERLVYFLSCIEDMFDKLEEIEKSNAIPC